MKEIEIEPETLIKLKVPGNWDGYKFDIICQHKNGTLALANSNLDGWLEKIEMFCGEEEE